MGDAINFPAWKRNCTPTEKLREVLQYIVSRPEDMQNVLIMWTDEGGIPQYQSCSCTTIADAVYMIEVAKHQLLAPALEIEPD